MGAFEAGNQNSATAFGPDLQAVAGQSAFQLDVAVAQHVKGQFPATDVLVHGQCLVAGRRDVQGVAADWAAEDVAVHGDVQRRVAFYAVFQDEKPLSGVAYGRDRRGLQLYDDGRR